MAVPRPGSALDAADDRSGERRSAVGESVPSAYGPSAYVPRIRPMSAPRRAPLRVVPDGRTPAEPVRRPLPGPGPPRSERRRYVPALDGLRAIAVAAVVAYHLGFGWARGGYFGVDVFFVLSGYLITDGLLTGRRRRGAVDLASFWVGRARRLLPALVVMLIVVAAAATAMARGTLGALRGDTLAAVTYTSNWWQIWRAHSYFTAIGSTSPLTHLWSLAVEEQFYLLWPILLAAAMRWLPRRVIVQATLGGAVFSAVAMGVLYRGTRDPTRVYVGTDTHATALLLGAALAFGWPLLAPAPGLTRPGRRLLSLGGLAAAVGLGACVHLVHGQGIVEYRGLFAVVAVLSAVVIAAAAHPATALGRCLGVAPLRWIGARSYGIYLWHYPVIVLSRTAFGTAASRLPAQLIQAALAVGLAAASWRLVEKPIKLHGFAAPVRRVLSFTRSLRRPGAWQAATATGVGGVVAVALVGLTLAPGPGSSVDRVKAQIAAGRRIAAESQQRAVQQQTGQRGTGQRGTGQRGTGQRGTGRPGTARQGSGRAGAGGPPTGPKAAPAGTKTVPAPTGPARPVPPPRGSDVLGIGDSVMLAAATELSDELPGMLIDAQISRQMWDVPALIQAHRADGTLRTVIVLAVGTNGPFTTSQLTGVLDEIGPGHRVIVVNIYAARDWEASVNQTLASVAKSRHLTVIDWHDAIGKHAGELWGDGIHPQPSGARRYAALLLPRLPAADRKRAPARPSVSATPSSPHPK